MYLLLPRTNKELIISNVTTAQNLYVKDFEKRKISTIYPGKSYVYAQGAEKKGLFVGNNMSELADLNNPFDLEVQENDDVIEYLFDGRSV